MAWLTIDKDGTKIIWNYYHKILELNEIYDFNDYAIVQTL